MAPGGDELGRQPPVAIGRGLQVRMHGHALGHPEQRQAAHAPWCGGGRGQGDQRPHAVTDERSSGDVGRIQHAKDPIRHRRDRSQRRAAGPPMPGEIEGQHRPPVMREIPRLQRPHGVVHAGAVNEKHGRLLRIEGPAAGGGEDRLAVDAESHRGIHSSDRIAQRSWSRHAPSTCR
jgi:hypothetical protein